MTAQGGGDTAGSGPDLSRAVIYAESGSSVTEGGRWFALPDGTVWFRQPHGTLQKSIISATKLESDPGWTQVPEE